MRPISRRIKVLTIPTPHNNPVTIMNRLLSVVRSRTDKIIELSRAARR